MRTTMLAAFFAAGALAIPAFEKRGGYSVCHNQYPTPQCCAVDVLGIADLDCQNPAWGPTSNADLVKACASVGQQAKCCVLPVAGQDILCETPLNY